MLMLAVWAGFAGATFSIAEEGADLPALRLICKGMEVDGNAGSPENSRGRGWNLEMKWKLENPSTWDVAWCEEDKVDVVAEDPGGCKSKEKWCFYHNRSKMNREGNLSISFTNWLPVAGSRSVQAKGKVPFAVSRQQAVTEPVTVKLVKDFSVPVVLKGAGLPGTEDIKATLKVEKYSTGQKGSMKLSLTTDRPLGFRGFELQTMAGQPVAVTDRDISSFSGRGEYEWQQEMELEGIPDAQLKVLVRYADRPQLAWAAVNSRASLSGVGDGNDSPAVQAKAAKPDAGKSVAKGEVRPPAAEPCSDGAGKASVRAELCSMSISSREEWRNGASHETPMQLSFEAWLIAGQSSSFGRQRGMEDQSLEVTDSTGRVLEPAVFGLGYLFQQEGKDMSFAGIKGECVDLPSPGAEWVRLKGAFRVPVGKMGASPVYELPLKKGAKLDIPVPGENEAGEGDGDVADTNAARTCQLSLSELEWKTDQEAELEVNLLVEGMPFDFDEFELLDAEGKPLDASMYGGGGGSGDNSRSWLSMYRVGNAKDMKVLRVRLKYRAGMDIETVPVDVTIGLGGPVPQKEAAVRKAPGKVRR